MKNLSKMSIDELQQELSMFSHDANSGPASAVLLSKTIIYLSNEIAVFKEALSNSIGKVNSSSNKMFLASVIYFLGILILTTVIAFK